MEHRPDQQPATNVAGVGSSSAFAMPNSSVQRAGTGTIFFRTTRLLLRRILYLLARLFGPLRRYAVFLVVILALLGVISWLSYLLLAPVAAAPPDTRVSYIAPAASVENYIKGRQNYNAELMWSSLSPDFQARRMQSGQNKANLQAMADQERNMGVHYLNYEYIGGTHMDDGQVMYFYSARFDIGSQHLQFPATFFVNPDGKVDQIFAVDPSQLLSDSSSSSNGN